MTKPTEDTTGPQVTPLRPPILIDADAGRLNKGDPDREAIARELPDWDLLPPHQLVGRASTS
jgi:hypothetical protein